MDDAERTMPTFQPVPYYKPQTRPESGLRSFRRRPHPGFLVHRSAITGRTARRSAWVSRATSAGPIPPSSAIPRCCRPSDYLILESTYGGRLHKDNQPRSEQTGRGGRTNGEGAAGRIIVPAFAVGRTQTLVLLLHQLTTEGRVPTSRSSWTARWR